LRQHPGTEIVSRDRGGSLGYVGASSIPTPSIWTGVCARAVEVPPASGGSYGNKASAGRRTSSATGFYGAEVIAVRLRLHHHKDLLFALHRDIQSGSCSKEQLQQSATSMSCTGLRPWSLHLRRSPGSSSVSSGIVTRSSPRVAYCGKEDCPGRLRKSLGKRSAGHRSSAEAALESTPR
jgi:hypothetical protein